MGNITVAHEPVDLVGVLEAVRRSLLMDVPYVVGAGVGRVCGDGLRVRQVVRNLITNSLRYGGEHREVRIHEAGDMVFLDVFDDGSSLATEDLDRIFLPYATAHASTGLTDSVGLGLAVSRYLCELMGGSLEARVDADGTTFRLALPVRGTCSAAPARATSGSAARG
jgi:signal transduction histidine kinase